MAISRRKVIEVTPKLHEAVKEEAEKRFLRVSLLGSVLLAYGLAHAEQALSEADSLLIHYEHDEP